MTDNEFMDRAETLLQRLEALCDQFNDQQGLDIDNQRVGGMVTMTFPNRSQLIVNLQKPLHEVWLAAQSGGYHFRFDGIAWQDTKGQCEFWQQLTRDAGLQYGQALNFTA